MSVFTWGDIHPAADLRVELNNRMRRIVPAIGQITYDVTEADVKAHEAALSIAASQVTAGTFGAGNYNFPGDIVTQGTETEGRLKLATAGPYIELAQRGWSGTAGMLFSAYASDTYVNGGLTTTGNTKHKYPASVFGTSDHRAKAIVAFHNLFAFYVSGVSGGAGTDVVWNRVFQMDTIGAKVYGSGSMLQLHDSSATGSPHIELYQAGTRRGFLLWDNTTETLQIRNEKTGTVHLSSATGDEVLRVRHISGTSSPYLAIYQDNTLRAYLQFNNAAGTVRLGSSTSNPIEIRTATDEMFRLNHPSSTGDPYISFYQNGVRRAYIQFRDVGSRLRMKSEESGIIEFQDSVIEIGPSVAGSPNANHGRLYTISSGTQLWYRDPSGTNTRIV